MHSWLKGEVAFYSVFNSRAGKVIGRVFLASVCTVGIGNVWSMYGTYHLLLICAALHNEHILYELWDRSSAHGLKAAFE